MFTDEPHKILTVVKRYATCLSYRDQGTVEGSLGAFIFRTTFDRSIGFAFEWFRPSSPERSNFFWIKGMQAYVYFHRIGRIESLAIATALARVRGGSQAMADQMACLLMPEFGKPFSGMTTLFDKSEPIEGSSLSIFSSPPSEREKYWLWIDEKQYSILKQRLEINLNKSDGTAAKAFLFEKHAGFESELPIPEGPAPAFEATTLWDEIDFDVPVNASRLRIETH